VKLEKLAPSKEAFDEEARGLTYLTPDDLSAAVILIEPVDGAYFRDETRRQRCIVDKEGKLYLARYD